MASDLATVRSTIEARLSTQWASRTTIEWPDRPFTPPASGGWLRVSVLFGDAFAQTMDGMNLITGVLDLSVFDWAGRGIGPVTQLADYARRAVNEVETTGVIFGVPQGPQEVVLRDPNRNRATRQEIVQFSVSAPFTVPLTET